MANSTTLEDDYSGLVEEGFEHEQVTLDWGEEFYEYIELHRDSKMDITISTKSAANMQKEFDDGGHYCRLNF